jgi:hypothetical protein
MIVRMRYACAILDFASGSSLDVLRSDVLLESVATSDPDSAITPHMAAEPTIGGRIAYA